MVWKSRTRKVSQWFEKVDVFAMTLISNKKEERPVKR